MPSSPSPSSDPDPILRQIPLLGQNPILGQNQIIGQHNQIVSQNNQILGQNNQIVSQNNQIYGQNNQIHGQNPKPARRIPPPCWTDGETVALIECYREKWYSLRRGNLRAPDWQEVADGVAGRCPAVSPAKTPIQCRHKMEKLRKRYRSEIQRIGSNRKAYGCSSSWIHFKLMDDMELGLNSSDLVVNVHNQNDDVSDNDEDEDEDDLTINRNNGNGNGNGVRIKIPSFAGVTSAAVYRNSRLLDDLPPSMSPGYGYTSGGPRTVRNGYMKEEFGGGVKRKSEGENVMEEMVAAIRRLGDGFVKMERMKMDMARELEAMRMKAEMKQTEMILETHRKMWESFEKSVLEKKKVKRMGADEE